ncbi:MAG: hypothetical protein GF350_08635 [Chitinivibrionales bacterium]|nr:hypothetical protein [Chitinivibrionales bacterium]
MSYGELRFDDEEDEDMFPEKCEFCGRSDGHDADCLMRERYDEIDEIEES